MQANIGWIKREGSCFDKLPNGTRIDVLPRGGILMVGSVSYQHFKDYIVAWRPVGTIKWPHTVKA